MCLKLKRKFLWFFYQECIKKSKKEYVIVLIQITPVSLKPEDFVYFKMRLCLLVFVFTSSYMLAYTFNHTLDCSKLERALLISIHLINKKNLFLYPFKTCWINIFCKFTSSGNLFVYFLDFFWCLSICYAPCVFFVEYRKCVCKKIFSFWKYLFFVKTNIKKMIFWYQQNQPKKNFYAWNYLEKL